MHRRLTHLRSGDFEKRQNKPQPIFPKLPSMACDYCDENYASGAIQTRNKKEIQNRKEIHNRKEIRNKNKFSEIKQGFS